MKTARRPQRAGRCTRHLVAYSEDDTEPRTNEINPPRRSHPTSIDVHSSLLGSLWHTVIMLLHYLPLLDGFLRQVARPFTFALPLPPDEADKIGDHLMADLRPLLERIVDHRSRFPDDFPRLEVWGWCSPLGAGYLGRFHVLKRDGVELAQLAAWKAIDFSHW